MASAHQLAPPPAAAESLLGDRLEAMLRFAELLAEHGVPRGLIGPRELDRLWDRHLLNSAAIAELVPEGATVLDVGSGAGLPGLPLAIARPDLQVTLLEPMARRVQWLDEVVPMLGVQVSVLRGRAEERRVRASLGEADVVTARAVAALGKLCEWCLPLTKVGGTLLALKGERAVEELNEETDAVRRAGGAQPEVLRCGVASLEVPTTVVSIKRAATTRGRGRVQAKRKDR